jgi:hypothetical protein
VSLQIQYASFNFRLGLLLRAQTDIWKFFHAMQEIKTEAMGPRHATSRLSTVLAEPALSAVTAEAREAAAAGWFWQIRPLKVRIESIDTAALTPEGGYAIAIAAVDESADLWATNGKKGDSYATSYKVEYTLVRSKGGWRIAAALVVGR